MSVPGPVATHINTTVKQPEAWSKILTIIGTATTSLSEYYLRQIANLVRYPIQLVSLILLSQRSKAFKAVRFICLLSLTLFPTKS